MRLVHSPRWCATCDAWGDHHTDGHAADHCDACNNHPARWAGVANEKCCTCCRMPDGSRPRQGIMPRD